jgi:RimJ/RimL family protein N-acetyltransferase
MSILLSQSSSVHISPDRIFVNFHWDTDLSLNVTIETDRLYMRSVQDTVEDLNAYIALMGDQEVVSKYTIEPPKNRDRVQEIIRDVWVRRWKENDPYSAFAVFESDSFDFVGHIAIDHGEFFSGQAELTFMFHNEYSTQDYENEAVSAIVKDYIPATIEEGYKMDCTELKEITAKVIRNDSEAGQLLEKKGFYKVSKKLK